MQCAALTSFFFLRRLVLTTGLFSCAMIELMMMMMINSRLIVMIILMNMIIMMMMTLMMMMMMMMMMMSWRSYSLNVFKVLTWTSPFSYLSLKYPFETFLVVAGFLYERKKQWYSLFYDDNDNSKITTVDAKFSVLPYKT